MEGAINTVDPCTKGYSGYNQNVSVFEFADVVVAKNYKELDRVRLVSGGTSSHIYYVGKGMLTASVQGPGSHPPSPSAILRTLRELSLNQVKGIVVIVQASSTDVLSFGVAVERAANDDLRVTLVGVSEDCQNIKRTKAEKRGLSGIVLVNKIAGALAENNKTMHYITDYCKRVVDNMISNSINVNNMLVTRECLYCKKCAQGIIHVKGQKKSILKKISFTDILSEVVSTLFQGITAHEKFIFTPEVSLVILVNHMGVLSKKHEYLLLKECIEFLNVINIKVARFYVGKYLLLNYEIDLTLTVLKVFDRDLLPMLDFPCSVPGWKPVFQYEPFISLDNIIPGSLRRKCRLSPPTKGPKLRDKPLNVVQLCLQFACDALISCERMLNKMDSERKGGDADTGTRLKNVAEVLNKRTCNKKLYMEYPFTFFLCLSKLLEQTAAGTMGCIYCIIFEAAAKKFGEYKEEDEVTPFMWLEALENACDAVKKYGNVEVGDKTMYDPLQACATAIRQHMSQTCTISAFSVAVAKAEETAHNTKKHGRKYPDAGAHAVAIWLRAVYEGVKLRCLE